MRIDGGSISNRTGARGLKWVSKFRIERISAIADSLAASDYDIITLQEVWVHADYELIRGAVANRLPYAKLFYRYATSLCC